MQRKTFIKSAGLTLAGLPLISKQTIAAIFAQEPWKIKMLTNDIGIFTEMGGTILFYLSNDGIVVVDSQFPDAVKHLIDELKKKTTNPFKLLINTHHHMDHTAGNIAFKDLVPHVVAHANSLTNQKNAAIKNKSEDKQLYPDLTFTDTWAEKFGKEKIHLQYFGAAHTNGDIVVHLPHADIVHLGDLMFNRKHPYVDKSAGANVGHWIEVLDKTTATFSNKTTFVCGHAFEGYEVIVTKDDLKAFGDYLGNALKFVSAEVKSGKTKEDILKNTSFAGMGTWKGEGIERPLEAAYKEITEKMP